MEHAYRDREAVFAAVMDDRHVWEHATARERSIAVAADAEFRRRHPDEHLDPLRSAEPDAVTDAEAAELAIDAGQQIPQMGEWISALAAGSRMFTRRLAERRDAQRENLEGLSYADPSEAFPAREAMLGGLLQHPKPPIPPSARVLEQAAGQSGEMQAVI